MFEIALRKKRNARNENHLIKLIPVYTSQQQTGHKSQEVFAAEGDHILGFGDRLSVSSVLEPVSTSTIPAYT